MGMRLPQCVVIKTFPDGLPQALHGMDVNLKWRRFGEWAIVFNIPIHTRLEQSRLVHLGGLCRHEPVKCSSAADQKGPGAAGPPLWYLFCLKSDSLRVVVVRHVAHHPSWLTAIDEHATWGYGQWLCMAAPPLVLGL